LKSTTEEVKHVHAKALELLKSKEEVYEDSWVREGIRVLSASNYRKASGLEVMFRNGSWKKQPDKVKEDLLDEINYAAILYRLMEMEEEKE